MKDHRGTSMNPFVINEPTCISFSGGRTSAYMLYRILEANGGLPEGSAVCFANTGKECEETLEFVKHCGERWNVSIHWIEYRHESPGYKIVDFQSASRNGEPFLDLMIKNTGVPNVFMRFCTEKLKIKPIRKFLKDSGFDIDDDCHLVGIRADEPRRIAKVGLKMCPLALANINSEDVGRFWASNDFDLKLPAVGYNKMSNCDLCFMKGEKILFSIIEQDNNRALWWINAEKSVNTIRESRGLKPVSFRKGKSYQYMLDMAKSQKELISTVEEEPIGCFCGD